MWIFRKRLQGARDAYQSCQEKKDLKPNPFPMASTTARMNPLQIKDKNPYQTPTIAVNLPKQWSHPCTRIKSRSSTLFAQLNDEEPRLRVAYQGVPGAYSESAALKAYPICEPVPCPDFETCFLAVESGLVDRALLPIENSLGGSIHRNYDLLFRHRLHIVGEKKLLIRHCLLANPNVKLEDLKSVHSHPQALAQCEKTLTNLGLVRVAVDDTAGAAKDDSYNVTRFIMLARKPIIPGTDKPFKTSIVFSLEEGPGELCKALTVFEKVKINLTKIESRPLQKQASQTPADNIVGFPKGFGYIFYADFEASMAESRTQDAIGHLKKLATSLRLLGSYPADNSFQ
ncbi:arogenate dehydratase 2-like isoform X4 [Primulina huaijiensis]|uniref:arogenate dehydratase 2-like isoform X4 n=1 Tax=Primulina huaijiensis TaxID=1492673 RepID=UPI003CC79706